MAKRYTDSNKWDDPWYQELLPEHKLAWDYICGKCDPVGVWKPSKKSLDFHTGVSIVLADFLRACSSTRIFVMENGNWWIIGFCEFQYGPLDETSKSSPIISYIKTLKKYNLWEGYKKGIYTLKDKDKDKEQEKEEGGVGETDEFKSQLLAASKKVEAVEKALLALDEIYIDQERPKWNHIDFDFEVKTFCEKVRGSPEEYENRDAGKIRLAFQYQLRNAKKKNTHAPTKGTVTAASANTGTGKAFGTLRRN